MDSKSSEDIKWDDTVIMECYAKAMKESREEGNKGGKHTRKKRKTRSLFGSEASVGAPGPWTTFNRYDIIPT